VASSLLKRALIIFFGLGACIAGVLALVYIDAHGQATVLRAMLKWLLGDAQQGDPVLYHDVYFVYTGLDLAILFLLVVALCLLLAGAWTLIARRRAK